RPGGPGRGALRDRRVRRVPGQLPPPVHDDGRGPVRPGMGRDRPRHTREGAVIGIGPSPGASEDLPRRRSGSDGKIHETTMHRTPYVSLAVLFLAIPARLPAQGLEYVQAHYTKFEYRIPMRDGVKLFTA